MTKAADLALGKIAALKTALIEFTDGDDAIAVADAGVVTLLTTAVAKSEGGAVTHNITQGLAKVWLRYNGTGTAALTDSFNISSFSDGGTGIGLLVYTSNMGNANYNCTMGVGEINGGGNRVMGMRGESKTLSTSELGLGSFGTNFSAADQDFNCATVHGDLA